MYSIQQVQVGYMHNALTTIVIEGQLSKKECRDDLECKCTIITV